MNMNKMMDRFFRQVNNVVWDMMTGRVGFSTPDGICSIDLGTVSDDKKSAPDAQVSINVIDDFGMAIPAFAQSIPADQISLGDMIYSSATSKVLGWVIEKNDKGLRLMRQDGTSTAWKAPKVEMLGFESGVMVLRSLTNMLPNGQSGLGQMQSMLMPMMMMGMIGGDEGDDSMSQMIPMMLMSQMGLGGTDPSVSGGMMNSMMQMMMMQKMMGGNIGTKPVGKTPFFNGRQG